MSKILVSVTAECYNVINKLKELSMIDADIVDECRPTAGMDTLKATVSTSGGVAQFVKQPDWIQQYQAAFTDPIMTEFSDKIAALSTGPRTVIIDQALVTKRMPGANYTVGIVLNTGDYDIDHLVTHEGLSKSAATKVLDECNSWMRLNRSIYDIFIENKSVDEIVEIIKAL